MFGFSESERRQQFASELANALRSDLGFDPHIEIEPDGNVLVFAQRYRVPSERDFAKFNATKRRDRENYVRERSRFYAKQLNRKVSILRKADGAAREEVAISPVNDSPALTISPKSVVVGSCILAAALVLISFDISVVCKPDFLTGLIVATGAMITLAAGGAAAYQVFKGRPVPSFLQLLLILIVVLNVWFVAYEKDGKTAVDSLTGLLNQVMASAAQDPE